MSKKFIPAISVVIPMYNAEKYIGECIESILAQTFKDFEIIVVDDCSTDNSCAVVEKYILGGGVDIKLIRRKKNSGNPATPSNLGIKLSRGEYIFLMDNDDMITKTAFEELYTIAKNFDADVVSCEKFYQFKTLDDVKVISCNTNNFSMPTLIGDKVEDRINSLMKFNFFWNLWSKLIRRDFIIENNIEIINATGQDMLFTCCIICAAKKIVSIPTAINLYRIHGSNLSSKAKTPQDRFRQWCYAINFGMTYIDKLLDNQEDFKNRTDLKYMVFDIIVRVFTNYLLPIYAQIPAYQFDEIIREELAKVDNKDALTAFIFSRMNMFNISLIQQQQVIQQLQK